MNQPPLPLPKPLPPASTTDPPPTPIGRQRLDVGTRSYGPSSGVPTRLGMSDFEHAVEATGGMHFRTLHNKAILPALDKIGGELHAQYLIAYNPNSNSPLTGFTKSELRCPEKN